MVELAQMPCRRQSVRRWVRVEAEVVRARDFRRVGGCVIDLSPDGMRVVAEASVAVGDELVVAFRAPVTGAWVECGAWVAHVCDDDTFGAVFDALDDEARDALEASLARVPPIVPRRISGTYARVALAEG